MLELTHFKVPTGEQSLGLGEDGLDGELVLVESQGSAGVLQGLCMILKTKSLIIFT